MAGEKSGVWANGLLALLFNASAVANIADNAASAPLTNLYVALHTADPTASGNQTSNEVAYTGYARVAVARNGGGWAVSSGSVTPAATVIFGLCTAGTSTATYFSIGTASTGAGTLLYAGPLTPSISIANGVTPELTTSTTISEA